MSHGADIGLPDGAGEVPSGENVSVEEKMKHFIHSFIFSCPFDGLKA